MNLYFRISAIVILVFLLQSCTLSNKNTSYPTKYMDKYVMTCPNGVPMKIKSTFELDKALKNMASNDDYVFINLYPDLNPPQSLHPDSIVNTSIVAKSLEGKGYEQLHASVGFINEENDGAVVSLAYGNNEHRYFINKFYQKVDVESASSYKLLIYEQVKYYER